MKHYKKGLSPFLVLSLFAVSCSKNSGGPTSPQLTLSKSVVKIGEPLTVSTNGMAAGSSVEWSSSPMAARWTSATGDSATFLFITPGRYDVTATYRSGSGAAAYDSSHSSVTVSDSVYNADTIAFCNSVLNLPISAGDNVILTPIIFSDSAGLVFLAHTSNGYTGFPSLSYSGNLSGAGEMYEADFTSVLEYPCNGSAFPAPAITDVFFNSLKEGVYTLICKLNGTTYQGSMTVTGVSCSFTWTYTSGVTISPLQIQKL